MSVYVRPLHVSNRWNFWSCSYLGNAEAGCLHPRTVLHQRSDSTSSTSSTSNEPRATLNETPKRDTSWVYQLYQYDLWSGNQRSLLRVHRAPRFCDYDLSIFFTADLHGTLWKACGKCPSLLITFVSPVMSHGFKREH